MSETLDDQRIEYRDSMSNRWLTLAALGLALCAIAAVDELALKSIGDSTDRVLGFGVGLIALTFGAVYYLRNSEIAEDLRFKNFK